MLLQEHLYANRNEDNAGDKFGNFRLESFGGMASDFKPDNAHHKACHRDGGYRKRHIDVHERERDADGECVDACGDGQKQDVREAQMFARNSLVAASDSSPNHTSAQDAEDGAGDWRPYGAEPALCKTPEKKSKQGHAALENSETHCLEHGAAVLDAGLAKAGRNGDRKAVHRLDNCDNDDF